MNKIEYKTKILISSKGYSEKQLKCKKLCAARLDLEEETYFLGGEFRMFWKSDVKPSFL